MKKWTMWILICAMLLSVSVVCASAELPAVAFTPGKYLGGDSEAYSPVGEITVAWRPNFASEVDMTDGDLSDWYAAGLTEIKIIPHNMVSWVGGEAITDFGITAFSAADADYLYLAFDIVDPNFTYASEEGYYDGDAIQLSLDFGRKMGDQMEMDPDVLASPKNIFYSFSCVSDGAPIRIMCQESANDGWLTEENGDGVKGAARKTENGWSAEIALSWELMYDHYVWKSWDDGRIYVVEGGADRPMKVGACLYYLNRAETGKEILWAAGTLQDYKTDDGTPVVSWTAYDNGITWTLPVEEGVTFNCGGIIVTPAEETQTVAVEGVTTMTEPPYDPPAEPDTETNVVDLPTWVESLPPDTLPPEVEETLRDAAESLDKEDELNAILEKYGCSAVFGMGSLTALLALAAAAWALRRKD